MTKKNLFPLLVSTIAFALFLGILPGCQRRTPPPPPIVIGDAPVVSVARLDMHNPDALVDVPMLVEMIGMPNVVVLDVSPAGHNVIPGAIWIDRNTFFRYVDGNNFGTETIAIHERILGANGIGNDTTVIIYDDANGMHASRIFFHLYAMGHRDVRLLDGGLGAWIASGYPVHSAPAAPGLPVTYTAAHNMDALRAGLPHILYAKDSPEWSLLDVRTPAEWDAGRIPGAIQLTFPAQFLNEDFTIRARAELEEIFSHIPRNTHLITYCGGGFRATFAHFIFSHVLGWPNTVLFYDGGWFNYTWAGAPVEY